MNTKRVLIISPFGIGDTLFTFPVVANIKKACPECMITYISNDRTADFLRQQSDIDQVISYERDAFVQAYKSNFILFLKKWQDLIIQVKSVQYDVVLDFSLNRMFGFVAFMAGIPVRVGYAYKGRGTFLNRSLPLAGYEGRHVVEYYLDLLGLIGIPVIEKHMRLAVAAHDEQWAVQWLHHKGIKDTSKLVAVMPAGGASWGSRANRKRWPIQKYAQLIDKMVADLGVTVILFGDAKESAVAQEIASLAASPVYSAVGQTTILQMAALLKYCSFAVVNDGGPLHVAVASGIKTISIFGPVDDAVYGPFPVQGHVVVKKMVACQPCYRRFFVPPCEHMTCLETLSVSDVYRKVSQVYEHTVY